MASPRIVVHLSKLQILLVTSIQKGSLSHTVGHFDEGPKGTRKSVLEKFETLRRMCRPRKKRDPRNPRLGQVSLDGVNRMSPTDKYEHINKANAAQL